MKESRRVVINHGTTSRVSTSNNKIDPVNKGTVIAIAAVATVVVLALIGIGICFFLRRRSRKTRAKRNNNVDASDRRIDNPKDFTSKTPLMQEENQFQTEYHASPMPKYDEENDIDLSAPPTLHHSFSGVSLRSLPPSYSAVAHRASEGAAESTTHSRYVRDASIGGSDGLRPLMLVAAQKGEDTEQDIAEQRGRDRQSSPLGESSLMPARLAVRPRASSRFREEDLDM